MSNNPTVVAQSGNTEFEQITERLVDLNNQLADCRNRLDEALVRMTGADVEKDQDEPSTVDDGVKGRIIAQLERFEALNETLERLCEAYEKQF